VKVQIEKGRSIPGTYPFAQMEVGDSFRVPDGIKRGTIRIAAIRFSKKTGARFVFRSTEEGFYCWRTQ
jgi:hypothetical protein